MPNKGNVLYLLFIRFILYLLFGSLYNLTRTCYHNEDILLQHWLRFTNDVDSLNASHLRSTVWWHTSFIQAMKRTPKKVVGRSFGMLKTLHKRWMLLSSEYFEASIHVYTWLKKKTHLKCWSKRGVNTRFQIPLQERDKSLSVVFITELHRWMNCTCGQMQLIW